MVQLYVADGAELATNRHSVAHICESKGIQRRLDG
jgi:hypothetical protein